MNMPVEGYTCSVCHQVMSDDGTLSCDCTIRLAVVGSRTFNNYALLSQVLGSVHSTITEIVSGGAKGADTLAKKYALEHGITIQEYLPDWFQLGRRAGYVRNTKIVANSDALIAFWDGRSKGTRHSIRLAMASGLPLYIRRF